MEQIVLGIVLGVGSYQDIRKKSVGLWLIFVGAGAAVVMSVAGMGDEPVKYIEGILVGLTPGAILVLISVASRGRVGMGDALMVLVMGLFVGFRQTMGELLVALLFSGVFSLALVVIKKCGKEKELPFIPFLMAAHLTELCILRQALL